MKRFLSITMFLAISSYTNLSVAQDINYSVTFGDMGATMYPFQQLFNNTFFPSLKLSAEYNYLQTNKSTIFQTFDFNNLYHGTIGYVSGLGTAGGYRYSFIPKFSVEIILGLSLNFVFPKSKQFKINPDGTYTEKKLIFIKPGIFSAFSFAYELSNKDQIFLQYGYNTFLNYNRSVSMLPYETIMIGYRLIPKQ